MLTRYFNIYGVYLKVRSVNKDLISYIDANLASFSATSLSHLDLDITLFFNEYTTSLNNYKSEMPNRYLGSELYLDKGLLGFKDKGMTILVDSKSNLTINSTYNYRLDQCLRKLIRFPGDYVINAYQRIYRFVVELPILFLLQKKGYTPVHASAILLPSGKVNIYAGLNGAGKSTTALNTHMACQGVLISDNFSLIKDKLLYPLPGVMKLSSATKVDKTFSRIGTAYNKVLYKTPSIDITNGFELSDIYYVTRDVVCSKNKVLKRLISKENMLNNFLSMSYYLKEYPQYSYLSYLMDTELLETEMVNLKQTITDNINLYEVTV